MAKANIYINVKDLEIVKELINVLKENFEELPMDVKEYIKINFTDKDEY